MSLSHLRQEIDSIDEGIIAMVGKRIDLAKKIAKIKKEHNLPILDKTREEEICVTVKKLAKKWGLSAPMMEEIIQLILTYSRIEMGAI